MGILTGTGDFGAQELIEIYQQSVNTPEKFNSVGDGVSDDTLALQNAANEGKDIFIKGDYLVDAFTNKFGVELTGPGRLLKSVNYPSNGGIKKKKLNRTKKADVYPNSFGQEYLEFFVNKLLSKDSIKILLSGDSTTKGDGADVGYKPSDLLNALFQSSGITGVTVSNEGSSGSYITQWLGNIVNGNPTGSIANQLALNPDLWIIRWGITDPSVGRTPEQFLDNLRTGLTFIRSNKTAAQLSLMVMSPNSVYDLPNNRDRKFYDVIEPGIRILCREFQCAYYDTLNTWNDSEAGAGIWFDKPYTYDGAVHPKNALNTFIYGEVYKFLVNRAVEAKVGTAGIPEQSAIIPNVSASDRQVLAADLPSTFPLGLGIYRGTTGFPYDGQVLVVKAADGTGFQINTPYASADRTKPPMIRYKAVTGGANAWQDWVPMGPYNCPENVLNPTVIQAPTTYPIGRSTYQIKTANGWPFDGTLIVDKTFDGFTSQWAWQNAINVDGEADQAILFRKSGVNGKWDTPLRGINGVNVRRPSFVCPATRTADLFDFGTSLYDVTTGDGYPTGGLLRVTKNKAGAVVQELFSTTTARNLAYRRETYYNGSTTVWTAWEIMPSLLGSSKSYSLPAIPPGSFVVTTLTVAGASFGARATASMDVDLGAGTSGFGLRLYAWVSVPDTVSVEIRNVGTAANQTGTVNLGVRVD